MIVFYGAKCRSTANGDGDRNVDGSHAVLVLSPFLVGKWLIAVAVEDAMSTWWSRIRNRNRNRNVLFSASMNVASMYK